MPVLAVTKNPSKNFCTDNGFRVPSPGKPIRRPPVRDTVLVSAIFLYARIFNESANVINIQSPLAAISVGFVSVESKLIGVCVLSCVREAVTQRSTLFEYKTHVCAPSCDTAIAPSGTCVGVQFFDASSVRSDNLTDCNASLSLNTVKLLLVIPSDLISAIKPQNYCQSAN